MPTDYDRALEAARKDARDLSHTQAEHYLEFGPVRGGQGRTDEEVERKGDYLFTFVVVALVAAAIVGAFFAAWLARGAA